MKKILKQGYCLTTFKDRLSLTGTSILYKYSKLCFQEVIYSQLCQQSQACNTLPRVENCYFSAQKNSIFCTTKPPCPILCNMTKTLIRHNWLERYILIEKYWLSLTLAKTDLHMNYILLLSKSLPEFSIATIKILPSSSNFYSNNFISFSLYYFVQVKNSETFNQIMFSEQD